MNYLEALRLAHAVLRPRNYVEIGCRFGSSLALSRSPAIGIDPDFQISEPLDAPTRLYRMTSDDFFRTREVKQLLGGAVDFAFIDGMHNQLIEKVPDASCASAEPLVSTKLPSYMVMAKQMSARRGKEDVLQEKQLSIAA
jgi:hypothetical protein